jgi:hypothetical protein
MTLSLYDQDIVLWAEDTVTKLQARDFVNLDIEHLIEEVEALGKSQRHAVKSLLRRLLEHLLKRCYVPIPECHAGWQREIRNFRNDIQDLLDDAPSLRNFVLEVLPQCYGKALESVQEDYPQIAFPSTWLEDYDLEMLLHDHFWDRNGI